MSQAPPDPSRISWRWATQDDNARLCQLFTDVSMKADLHLTVERDPDYFALLNQQRADYRVSAVTVDGKVEGMGAFLARDGYLHGKKTRVGYVGDARFSDKARGGYVMSEVYGPIFRTACEEMGCEVMLTAIISSNELARKALAKRSSKYPNKPFYTPFREFLIQQIQFTTRGRPLNSRYVVRRAHEEDLPAVVAFLAADHSHRPFGYVFDESLLRHRLENWPGLSMDDFYLALGQDGRMVGCCAPWDAQEVKRYRVLGYNNRMKWIRRGFDVGARLLRFDKLPQPGRLFRYFYLTHVSVPTRDPDIMAALLDRVYRDYHGRGYHFFSCYVERDDPLLPAWNGYMTTPLPAHLYAVSMPGHRFNDHDFGSGWPGFEMGLV
jgi:hypothetical protein